MPDGTEKSRGFTVALGGCCSMFYPEPTPADRSPPPADESENALSLTWSFRQLIARVTGLFARLQRARALR